MTTRDKLTFVHAMARSTRATVRQCEALMRYAGTLARIPAKGGCNCDDGQPFHNVDCPAHRRDRIRRKVTELCRDISLQERCEGQVDPKAIVSPLFAGPVLNIRTPGGDEICVPS